jgi:hypothetical protein
LHTYLTLPISLEKKGSVSLSQETPSNWTKLQVGSTKTPLLANRPSNESLVLCQNTPSQLESSPSPRPDALPCMSS